MYKHTRCKTTEVTKLKWMTEKLLAAPCCTFRHTFYDLSYGERGKKDLLSNSPPTTVLLWLHLLFENCTKRKCCLGGSGFDWHLNSATVEMESNRDKFIFLRATFWAGGFLSTPCTTGKRGMFFGGGVGGASAFFLPHSGRLADVCPHRWVNNKCSVLAWRGWDFWQKIDIFSKMNNE